MDECPIAVGLFLCEKVIIEAETRNATLVNCFNRRVVASMPSEPLSFVIYAIMTNGKGNVPISLQIDRLDTMETIVFQRGTARFRNPLYEVRLSQSIQDVIFPVYGAYQVVLLAKAEPIAQRRFRIYNPAVGEEE